MTPAPGRYGVVVQDTEGQVSVAAHIGRTSSLRRIVQRPELQPKAAAKAHVGSDGTSRATSPPQFRPTEMTSHRRSTPAPNGWCAGRETLDDQRTGPDHTADALDLRRRPLRPAQANFDEFAEQWRPTYPAMISSWENAWHEFVPFLDFPPELRAAFRRRQPWSSAQSGKSLRTL